MSFFLDPGLLAGSQLCQSQSPVKSKVDRFGLGHFLEMCRQFLVILNYDDSGSVI